MLYEVITIVRQAVGGGETGPVLPVEAIKPALVGTSPDLTQRVNRHSRNTWTGQAICGGKVV